MWKNGSSRRGLSPMRTTKCGGDAIALRGCYQLRGPRGGIRPAVLGNVAPHAYARSAHLLYLSHPANRSFPDQDAPSASHTHTRTPGSGHLAHFYTLAHKKIAQCPPTRSLPYVPPPATILSCVVCAHRTFITSCPHTAAQDPAVQAAPLSLPPVRHPSLSPRTHEIDPVRAPLSLSTHTRSLSLL